jgi:hypothetical protein
MWTIDGAVFGNAVGASVVLPDGSKTLGIDEVNRAHSLGLRGVNTNADPQNEGYPDLADRH